MKKILFLSFIVGATFFIYLCLKDRKIFYFNLGDDLVFNHPYSNEIIENLKTENRFEKYYEYGKKNARITDFINDINDNVLIDKNKTIKNILIKADFITIWVGNNDISYKINSSSKSEIYNYIDDVMNDMNTFLQLIRNSSKEQVIIIGLFNSFGKEKEAYIHYYNERVKELCDIYQMDFLDVESYDYRLKDFHRKMAKQILKIVKK